MNNYRQPNRCMQNNQSCTVKRDCMDNKNNMQYRTRQKNLSMGCVGDMQEYPLAMAYVPRQSFENLYDPADALECGTLFKDLCLSFGGGIC